MRLLIISKFVEIEKWFCLLYSNENEIRDFVDCAIKIRQDSSEHRETPLKIKTESVLVPFSEHARILGKCFLNKLVNML